MDQQPQIIETVDGSLTLKHKGHGEAYHSFAGAATEANDLYIGLSGILDRFKDPEAKPVAVLDVGLGLGYNALSTIQAWLRAEQVCDVALVSLEIDRELVDQFLSGSACWQNNWQAGWRDIPAQVKPLSASTWRATLKHPTQNATLVWTIVETDLTSSTAFNEITESFDFVWQDPFSPKTNPELWTTDWFSRVAEHAAPGCTLMTYSVARMVKDGLVTSGWTYTLIPTTTSKRAWLKATKL